MAKKTYSILHRHTIGDGNGVHHRCVDRQVAAFAAVAVVVSIMLFRAKTTLLPGIVVAGRRRCNDLRLRASTRGCFHFFPLQKGERRSLDAESCQKYTAGQKGGDLSAGQLRSFVRAVKDWSKIPPFSMPRHADGAERARDTLCHRAGREGAAEVIFKGRPD